MDDGRWTPDPEPAAGRIDGTDLGGPVLADLAATLVDALRAPGGLIAIWHTEQGQVGAPAGAGLAAPDLAELGSLLTTAAPDLLGVLIGARPGVARVGVLPGWSLDLAAHQARRATPWGPLHVLALRVHATPAVPLVALIALVHPAPRLDLWTSRPHLIRLVIRQIELALQLGHLRERLVNEARWLEAVLTQSAEGLVLVDAQGRVAGCNRTCERLLGWSAGELYGRVFVEVLDARLMRWNGGEGEARWAGPLAAGAAPPDPPGAAPARPPIALVLTGRHGQQVYTEAGVEPVPGAGGQVLGAVVALRDVTAQREAEELQATFLSVISHELQTPLAVIRGYAELLADQAGTMPVAQLRPKLEIVADESDRLSKMVANLLDASRIQAGGLELRQEPVDIPRLVQQVVQRMELVAAGHPLVVAIPDDLPPVLADFDRVAQVLRNLVENAIKYSPPGGRITITADLASSEVLIHVSDEGIGVPEAERERIFARFARLNSRVVRQAKGVGLGLYIARAIVRAHGGRIWAGRAPGGGAQFSFSLPREHTAPLPVLFGRG